MPRNFLIACLALLAMLPSALAIERRYALAPGPVQIEFRAFGLGLLPISGGFRRFSGVLALDDGGARPACTLDLKGDASSLVLPSQAMTDDALGPDLLDVRTFPTFALQAACDGDRLDGTLTMHGVTRPLSMAVTRTAATWTASGTIDRRAWGMGARPLLAGPEVRLTIIAGLPR